MAIAVTAKVQIHFCALGQPELQIAFWKLDGSVFDGQVVAVQTDLWKRLHQIRLQAQELVGVHREPGTPLELRGNGVLSNSKSEVGELSVRALLEAELPGRAAAPLA